MNNMCILLIYINKYSYDISINDYYIDFGDYTPTMQISSFSYNGYLLLATNIMKKNDNCDNCYNKDFPNYFSMFMIFGYANGTDSIIDTSELFYNKDSNTNIKLFWYLYKNLSIENNIFGYIPKKEIKLTFIPEEIELKILWHDDKGINDKIKNILDEPLLRCYNSKEGDYCHVGYQGKYEYIIEPNNNLIKNSQFYYIDYQYILEETISNTSNSTNSEPKTYCGRTNRLKFKLCHNYCETCREYGSSDNDQKCLSCLPKYQYDYFYFSNKLEENPNICVPEKKYYNKNNNKLTNCILDISNIILTQQIIKPYVLRVIMIAHPLTQFIIKKQENVFIAILIDLKMVNVLQKI